MGLSASLTNALSGMGTGQASLEILSRNVANAGTPGYHRQSLSVIDTMGANSTFARTGGLERAFDQSLQAYYTDSVSNAGYTGVRTDVLERLQSFLGKPGDPGSLDTMFGNFQNALQSLGTSPDDFATRASAISQAQGMASTLNSLSQSVQSLRQESETQISSSVSALNDAVNALAQVNGRLVAQTTDSATRATLMDQRDRLVSLIAEQLDVTVQYRPDDTVSLMTKTGVGILDVNPSIFNFQAAGVITADKQFNIDPSKSNVGQLTLTTPSGSVIDLVQQNVLKSGKLAGLVDLRDDTLVNAQSQLDQIAAGLAQAMSTVTTQGTAASSGTKNGLSINIAGIRDGNDFTLNYTAGGTQKTIKVVRVDDTSKLPLDYVDAGGTRVVGADFSGGASAVANLLSSKLGPGFTVSGSGTAVTVLDDGAPNTTDVTGLTSHITVTGTQSGAALNLFVDTGDTDFTNNLDGAGQLRGFASRISVNNAVATNNTLLSQYQTGVSIGDPTRPNYLLNQLQTMDFAAAQPTTSKQGTFRLAGSVTDLISQTMDYTGEIAASAEGDDSSQQETMDSLSQRMDKAYGVNVDDEMSRLIEIQNAYAANSRIISVVQDLMNKLFNS
jgi:flagellar hook-associated protein 1 FlgK